MLILFAVYRGKPSAGCENCRKAKKKCTLEQPACTRCVKLNKQCSGYRDTTGLQIQDETLSVTRKAERKNAQASFTVTSATPQFKSRTATPAPDRIWDAEASKSQGGPDDSQISAAYGIGKRNTPSLLSTRSSTPFGIPTPRTIHSESSSSSEGTLELPSNENIYLTASNSHSVQQWPNDSTFTIEMSSLPRHILPKADEIAVSYFLNCFTANGHWDHILNYAALPNLDPCLTLSIRACGMAAFENIRNVPHGREWSRNMYLKAIGLLNEALRDPKRSKSDESLIAVTMLSFFEVSDLSIVLFSCMLTPCTESGLRQQAVNSILESAHSWSYAAVEAKRQGAIQDFHWTGPVSRNACTNHDSLYLG